MREYSLRFLIAMIIGICVLLLFITGRSDQSAKEDIFPSELKGSVNIV